MNVMHRLGLRGYLGTVRGRRSGLRLARRPEEIGGGDVVSRTEESMPLARRLEVK
jgi:Rrf2 family nitric oxide-sensitive transcriptional repressor